MKYLQSYQTKILLSFLGLILFLACWAYFQFQIDKRNKQHDHLSTIAEGLETEYLSKTRHLQNFLLYGYHESDFYTKGSQSDIDSFQNYLQKNYIVIASLKLQMNANSINLNSTIDALIAENKKLIDFVLELKKIYREKGYKDFGVEGEMRLYAHALQDSVLIPELNILQLRKNEKDFLLRGELIYANSFLQLIEKLIIEYGNKSRTKELLINYKRTFTTLVEYNKQIGLYTSNGLFRIIQTQLSSLDKSYLQLYSLTKDAVFLSKKRNTNFLYFGAFSFLVLLIYAVWRISKYLSKEIKHLNEIILNYIHSGFTTQENSEVFSPKILEISTLHRSFKLLKLKLKHMLDEKLSHQKMLVAAVIEGQEKERRNIGLELHDNINPMLATSKLYLGAARDNESERMQMIKTSSEIIDASIHEIRKLSHSLVGPPSNDFLLQESLKELITIVEVGASFKIIFMSNEFDESLLSENKKLILYRIVQEQLNNVVKYARAENVMVSIVEKKNELLLSIKDNGVGFDVKQKTKGIGLRNIETRLELVNGTLFLNSSPGNGCEMVVSVPV